MELKVTLETLLSNIEYYDDAEVYGYYINVETGEGYDVSECGVNGIEGEEGEKILDEILDSDKYLMLPHWGHIRDNYVDMAEGFIVKAAMDEKLKKKFMKLIKKINWTRNATAFLSEIHKSGLDDAWVGHETAYCEKYVRKWCAEHNITILEA